MSEMEADTETMPEYLVETVDRVRILTLNRPERRNALNFSLRRSLVDELLEAGADPEIRAVIITATGDQAFCSGADLKEMSDLDRRGIRIPSPNATAVKNIFDVILDCYKPTIAALNGTAVAGGFELALACDIRIAVPGMSMGAPEAKIGMGANFASVVLPRRLPLGIALEMLFTGELISSEEALRWGLVNRIVPRDQLLDMAMTLASKICANSPISVRAMKERAMKGLELPLPAAIRLEVGPDPYSSEDRKEGIAARLEGRKPEWKNR
ncbi:MAG: enoyl-CoA hydratase/isomerase family protein [Actinomycetota bacterium]